MNGRTGNVLDVTAVGIAGAAWVGWLTDVLALVVLALSAVWLLMRMGDWLYARFKSKE